MLTVYDRICKLASNASLGEATRIVFCAILNLTDKEDIISFTNDYIKHTSLRQARYDIGYMLGFFDMEERILWKEAVGDKINIDILYNRSETELYKFHIYLDKDGKEMEPFYNKEKGNHQSK